MSVRESAVVIIETSRARLRAGLGLHELLKTPTIELLARAGLRRSRDMQPVAASSRAGSSVLAKQRSVSEYIVGKQLDDLLAAGEDLQIVWPFANGEVSDWAAAEALWKEVLFTHLNIRRMQNESAVMHAICPTLSRTVHERTAKIFFERLNVPGYTLIERPLAQLYAANAVTGIVVDVGQFKTDVVPVVESLLQHNARAVIPVGLADCERYLAHLWQNGANQTVLATLGLEGDELHAALLELATHVLAEGLVRVPSAGETAEPGTDDAGVTDIAAVLVAGREKAVIEAGNKKKRAQASAAEREREREIAALDLITVPFRGVELTLGRERHRLCEPLFDPTLLNDVVGSQGKDATTFDEVREQFIAVQDAVHTALMRLDVGQRTAALDGLFVAGDLGNAKEYFAEYREKGDQLAAFLGASMVAKLVFQDQNGRNYVQKSDYSQRGPHAIIELCPTYI
ncbi:actin-like ATPase domain-containing protein [Auriculariales sp. MPI-PUGE-AT-0066]|nr:actin-like ATPase domain-containing protein [Auriculariales sp. MPI-PUGE-AT-0066]